MSPVRRLLLVAGESHRGKRLDHVLAEWLPGALKTEFSRAKARKLIVAGAVYLNRKRVRIASKTLLPGARIEVHVDLEKVGDPWRAKEAAEPLDEKRIAFEDDWIIVVDKPAGLPTQPTVDEARLNLFGEVKKLLAARGTAAPYVGLHHRLDRDTSGVVLFTKRKEANAGVAALFQSHGIEKIYEAICACPDPSRVPESWTIENFLKSERGRGGKALMRAVRAGGQPARTEIRVIARLRGAVHLEARPKTGRMHQIRVHLADWGLPILGDELYGAKARVEGVRPERTLLHACALRFRHPMDPKREIVARSPLPEDFCKALEALG